jgi:lysylphosphatidylglycerol synthetase-like protein (DUF2156 family)
VAAQGVINLSSALLSHPPERLVALRRLVPTDVIDSSRTFTLVAGALRLTTAWGLRRAKRRAFVAALFLCALPVPVNLLKAFDFEEATAASVLMYVPSVRRSRSPRIRARYLIDPDPLALPRVAIALVRAQSPGGFLSYFRSRPTRAHPLVLPPQRPNG